MSNCAAWVEGGSLALLQEPRLDVTAMGTSDSTWLLPCWRGWDAGTERPHHTTGTCLGQRAKRVQVCLGRSLGGEQGVGWVLAHLELGHSNLQKDLWARFELGCVLHLH